MTIAAPDKAPDRISGMFDAIAPRYDLLNRVLSAGIDRRWRARAIRSLQLTGRETLLDVCTGTADVALQAVSAARVIGVDFAGAMLSIGRRKAIAAGQTGRVALLRGDATRLPVIDSSVDAATSWALVPLRGGAEGGAQGGQRGQRPGDAGHAGLEVRHALSPPPLRRGGGGEPPV